ncbi:DNA polymerase I [Mesorhizobium sp. BR1-1-16]|uniref:DNA polymerase I n=1 Tax=Mesorhizobium sp. BR1-1-16 TaxID=2876653 RepID=UPI001CCC4014|nr:DNA polymerase I [Mesorhizobium sp. BR1-1-16]MBZ9937168.1 DNA polymerase I [Mesorhizobium sp. BR1-1-16]
MSEPSTSAPAAAPSRPIGPGSHVFLVDGSSYIFRAYHALPPLTRKSDGLPVGAVAGFSNMLWKLLKEANEVGVRPTHLAVVLDHSATTFRNEIYNLYKAQRPEPPEDLRPQFGLIRKAVHAFNVACIEQQGFEADDLIATYTGQAVAAGADVTIVASDKDLMQLIRPGVLMLDTMKGKTIGRDEVIEKFGVPPEKVVDVQSLAGDSVDNVPGVPGIGVKTAAQLIETYGSLEALLENAAEIKQPKRREALINFAEQARISMRLVTLDQNVPLATPIEELAVRAIEGERLIRFLKAMEFTTLTGRVAAATGVEQASVAPDAELSSPAAAAMLSQSLFGDQQNPPPPAEAAAVMAVPETRTSAPSGGLSPAALVEARAREARETPVDRSTYETVTTVDRLMAWTAEAMERGLVAVDTETTSLDPMQADLVGVSLALAPGKACYIPLAHRGDGDGLFNEGLLDGQIPIPEALAVLKPMLEDRSVLKVAQNLKYDWLVLARYGIEVAPFDDTMLISYVLDAGRGPHGMDPLSEKWLGHTPITFDDVTGKGKARITFDRVAIDRATQYAAEDADVTLRLWLALKPRLAAEGMANVYETLERPMVPVLSAMERRGISIDRNMLSRLSGDFAQAAAGLEAEIHQLAGQPFNIGSPKQLGDILFGVMGLPGASKTATGAWATGASILEELAEQGYELPQRILEWRQLTKLRSTYTDALPSYQHKETERVHTSYALAATTTGRLSSSEPNLQNIPVRTEAGRKIRKAFIAAPGTKLVSADYSQIELRLLAEIADIPALRQAFRDGLDIHALTASEMFGVPVEGMPSEVRRRAKAINFGIIYGISAFGLANQLGIGREEAGAYIKRYFERFPGIRAYMEETKRICRDKGYVTTLFGRRCHYPEIASKNASVRAFNERAAINARLQGSAADIIRRAMIRVAPALSDERLNARMLLQVHDELIFEVPDDEVERTLPLVTSIMERAPEPAVALSVPLKVDARAADNWDEAH